MNLPPAFSKWASLAASAIAVLIFCMSAYFKLSDQPMVIEQFVKQGGFPANTLVPIGILEVICTVLYVIPRTSVLGAVLLTGYLGGAIVVHVRSGESFVAPLIIGMLVWIGIYLREGRLHDLLPLRRGAI